MTDHKDKSIETHAVAKKANQKSVAGLVTALSGAILAVYTTANETGKSDKAWDMTLRTFEKLSADLDARDQELRELRDRMSRMEGQLSHSWWDVLKKRETEGRSPSALPPPSLKKEEDTVQKAIQTLPKAL